MNNETPQVNPLGFQPFLDRVKLNLDFINDFNNKHIDPGKLYYYLNGNIPNISFLNNIDCEKASAYLKKAYASEITNDFFRKEYLPKNEKYETGMQCFLLNNGIIVYMTFYFRTFYVLFGNETESFAEKLIKEISALGGNSKHRTSSLTLFNETSKGYQTHQLSLKRTRLNLSENYNDDFINIHQTILKSLKRKEHQGVVLLHGLPGTGKTSYIRYLLALTNKEVIFMNPNISQKLNSPDLLEMLLYNENSILVIEDAENIIIDRENDSSSPVSSFLSITDGLLSESLNVQIVCTFNTDISKIDPALMRKGRLIAKYEFKALSVEKAQKLSDKLGFKTIIKEPMTLADIYNQHEQSFEEKKQQNVGFAMNNIR